MRKLNKKGILPIATLWASLCCSTLAQNYSSNNVGQVQAIILATQLKRGMREEDVNRFLATNHLDRWIGVGNTAALGEFFDLTNNCSLDLDFAGNTGDSSLEAAYIQSNSVDIIVIPLTSLATNGVVQPAQATARQILIQAESMAQAEHKAIFVHFGASWCPWCRRLDAFLERPDVKPVFDKYFVPIKVVVQEDDKHKVLENPGGDELLQRFGGPDGLPFSASLDAHGKLIRNSINPAEGTGTYNIGFPTEPHEVAWFILMMRTASPQMSAEDVQTIKGALSSPRK